MPKHEINPPTCFDRTPTCGRQTEGNGWHLILIKIIKTTDTNLATYLKRASLVVKIYVGDTFNVSRSGDVTALSTNRKSNEIVTNHKLGMMLWHRRTWLQSRALRHILCAFLHPRMAQNWSYFIAYSLQYRKVSYHLISCCGYLTFYLVELKLFLHLGTPLAG